GLDDDWVQWLDWWGRDNDALIALRRVEDDEGRVKWWRKKAREGELPPVLALRLNCLDACVILDGHCRLRAGLLENVAPDAAVARGSWLCGGCQAGTCSASDRRSNQRPASRQLPGLVRRVSTK
ncbi:hypothetical protein ACV35N_35130, partial [Pseudomonas aeruginosa]